MGKSQTRELHHIGVAVNNLEESIKFYQDLGFSNNGVIDVPSMNIQVVFMQGANGLLVELVEYNDAERKNVQELHMAFKDNGDWDWISIPELDMDVTFTSGPDGEIIEFVRS